MLKDLGRTLPEDRIAQIISEVDKDKNGTIDFNEFVTLMQSTGVLPNPDDELLAVFRVFDKNGDGTISLSELSTVMQSLGMLSPQVHLCHLTRL